MPWWEKNLEHLEQVSTKVSTLAPVWSPALVLYSLSSTLSALSSTFNKLKLCNSRLEMFSRRMLLTRRLSARLADSWWNMMKILICTDNNPRSRRDIAPECFVPVAESLLNEGDEVARRMAGACWRFRRRNTALQREIPASYVSPLFGHFTGEHCEKRTKPLSRK